MKILRQTTSVRRASAWWGRGVCLAGLGLFSLLPSRALALEPAEGNNGNNGNNGKNKSIEQRTVVIPRDEKGNNDHAERGNRKDKTQVSGEMKDLTQRFQKMREDYLTDQEVLKKKLKGAGEQERAAIREQMRDALERWKEQQREFVKEQRDMKRDLQEEVKGRVKEAENEGRGK